MRTTVTIDDDIHRRLRDRARREGVPFESVVNRTLRDGLGNGNAPGRVSIETTDMGLRPGIDLSKALSLVAILEDEEVERELRVGR